MGRILAIDYGTKRCGIAVSDPNKIIAQALTTVDTGTIWSFLTNYIKTENVESIIVGDPMIKATDRSGLLVPLNNFINELVKRIPSVPIHRADERFTSKIAKDTLLQAGVNKKTRRNKKLLDKISAAVMLQSWLEKFHQAIPVVILLILNLFQQAVALDPMFSQYYSNTLYLNSAFAGSTGCPRIIAGYRNQWPHPTGGYNTLCTSYDQHINKLKGGVGVLLSYDNAGRRFKTSSIEGIYAYYARINKKGLSVRSAVKISYHHVTLDVSNLTFGDMIDKRYGYIYQTKESLGYPKQYIDFSTGILLYNQNFFWGVAADHITDYYFTGKPKYRTAPFKLTVHGGYIIGRKDSVSEKFSFTPEMMVMSQQGSMLIHIGATAGYRNIFWGIRLRSTTGLIVMAGCKWKGFRLNYSLDYTPPGYTRLGSFPQLLSHEFVLSYNLSCQNKPGNFTVLDILSF